MNTGHLSRSLDLYPVYACRHTHTCVGTHTCTFMASRLARPPSGFRGIFLPPPPPPHWLDICPPEFGERVWWEEGGGWLSAPAHSGAVVTPSGAVVKWPSSLGLPGFCGGLPGGVTLESGPLLPSPFALCHPCLRLFWQPRAPAAASGLQ